MTQADYTLSRIDRPKGKLLRKTDILCDYCGEDYFVVEEPGSETPTWLRCYNCDQYYYVTHGILCVNVILVSTTPETTQYRRAKSNLRKEKVQELLGIGDK